MTDHPLPYNPLRRTGEQPKTVEVVVVKDTPQPEPKTVEVVVVKDKPRKARQKKEPREDQPASYLSAKLERRRNVNWAEGLGADKVTEATAQPAQPYRNASYLAEPHPNDPEHQSLWIELQVCPRCGAVVHDEQLHDTWHANIKETLA